MVSALFMVSVMEDPAAKVPDGASTVSPAGAPTSERISGAAKVPCTEPHDRATVVDSPADNCTKAGLIARVQAGGTIMVSVRGAVWVIPPPVAVMVSGYDPALAVVAIVSVKVLAPAVAPAIVAGEKTAAAPVGRPETDSAIVELKRFSGVVSMTTSAALPVLAPMELCAAVK